MPHHPGMIAFKKQPYQNILGVSEILLTTANTATWFRLCLQDRYLKKEGVIVDDEGIKSGTSFSSPPLADTVVIFFDMNRHFVGVEYKSFVTNSAGWIKALRQIIKSAALDFKYSSSISLQPVTKRYEIIKLFKSFDRLIEFKVNLRLPNPDYSPAYQDLYERMENGGIKEYLQVMKNPNGLSQSQKQLPYKSALLAEAGYKEGPITFHGLKDGEKVTVKSDGDALKGKINTLRDYVRGIGDNAKAKEALHVVEAIRKEMNRLFPSELEE